MVEVIVQPEAEFLSEARGSLLEHGLWETEEGDRWLGKRRRPRRKEDQDPLGHDKGS